MKAIGLDLDGTLCDFTGCVLPIINRRLGTSFTDEDWTEYYVERCLGAKVGAILKELVNDPVIYLAANPIKDAVRAIRTLSHYSAIHIVTCRPQNCQDATAMWLHANQIPFDRLVVTEGNKADVIRNSNLTAFVDDRIEYAQEVAPFVQSSILFSQPWNQGEYPELVRLNGWQETLEYLLRRVM